MHVLLDGLDCLIAIDGRYDLNLADLANNLLDYHQLERFVIYNQEFYHMEFVWKQQRIQVYIRIEYFSFFFFHGRVLAVEGFYLLLLLLNLMLIELVFAEFQKSGMLS